MSRRILPQDRSSPESHVAAWGGRAAGLGEDAAASRERLPSASWCTLTGSLRTSASFQGQTPNRCFCHPSLLPTVCCPSHHHHPCSMQTRPQASLQEVHTELGCDTASPHSGYKFSTPNGPWLPNKSLRGHGFLDTLWTPVRKHR